MSQNTKNKTVLELPTNLLYWLSPDQYKDRSECRDSSRPCPCLLCEHHLYLKPHPKDPSQWIIDSGEMQKAQYTCRLDLEEQEAHNPPNKKLRKKKLPPIDSQLFMLIMQASQH